MKRPQGASEEGRIVDRDRVQRMIALHPHASVPQTPYPYITTPILDQRGGGAQEAYGPHPYHRSKTNHPKYLIRPGAIRFAYSAKYSPFGCSFSPRTTASCLLFGGHHFTSRPPSARARTLLPCGVVVWFRSCICCRFGMFQLGQPARRTVATNQDSLVSQSSQFFDSKLSSQH